MNAPSDRLAGYANPPVHSRFEKGQSGNPRGRPKKENDLWTLLRRVLNRKIKVQGSDRRMAISEALIRRLRELALAGDRRAMALQRRIHAEAEARNAAENPKFNHQEWEERKRELFRKFQEQMGNRDG